jgi:serine/threonine protein kinase/Tol biopolymer transport system component
MALATGTRLGPYEILSAIGAGGMGEVYRARDTKLDRDVAIKVLPEAFAGDPERTARFQREAKTLASLNHPHIAIIHGLEQAGDIQALVMELVEGETLADRIARGPIPIDEALAIAKQIAEALEAAHEQGIIHRDLKPANIKVTPDGTVKVLDFGLAKLAEPTHVPVSDHSLSPTITSPAMMTGVGAILGTAAYMSPEQASGKSMDKRADVWSFGVVLWELVTGKRLFDAETVSHTLADVLRAPIAFNSLSPDVPRTIQDLLRRCLERDPRNRLRDIGEARFVLDNRVRPERQQSLEATVATSRSQGLAWKVTAVLILFLAAITLGWWRSTRPIPQPLLRMSVDLGPDAVVGDRTTAVLSPDGTRIVFPILGSNGTLQLATRTLDQPSASRMSGTERGSDVFFSPDGQWIGFFADGKLKKAAVQGGAPMTLCDAPNARGGTWTDDGRIIFARSDGSGLMTVPSAGGTPHALTEHVNGDAFWRWPQALPGGKAVLFTESRNPFSWEDADAAVVSLDTGQVTVVQRGGYAGRYVSSRYDAGHLLYVHEGSLFAVHFDPRGLQTSGTPIPLLADVAGNAVEAGGQFDVSLNGSLVYVAGKAASTSGYPIAWMDASGKTAPLLTKSATYGAPRFSPDGKRLAFTTTASGGPDVWVYDWTRDIPTQLTFTGPGNLELVWTPDGKHIVFGSSAAGTAALWWMRADGSGEPQKLLERKNSGVGLRPQSFAPDGHRLAFDDNTSSAAAVEIWTLPLDLNDPDHPLPGKPEPFLTTAGRQVDAAFSPDGRWMAYSSNESGADEVFVRPFPGPGGKWRVSTGGGKFPTWSRIARELFYLSLADGRIMVAKYATVGDSFNPEKPRIWSDRPVLLPNFIRVLDLHPDGKRFAVFPRPQVEDVQGNVHVTFLLNFSDELHRRLP